MGMRTVFNILKFALILSVLGSCVPARKYYEIEANNKYYVDKNNKDSVKISKLVKDNGTQIMRILSLKRDSMKYHYDYDSLYNAYRKNTETGKLQIANIKRELNNRDIEVNHIEQQSKEIVYAFNSFEVETNTIYRQLGKFFYRYRAFGAKIKNNNWSVVITLPDNLLYIDDSHYILSQSGGKIINAVSVLISEHPQYHMDIVEYSRPSNSYYTVVDSISSRIVSDTLNYTIDSTGQVLNIPYSYPKIDVIKKELVVANPVSMKKGTSIIEYIEQLDHCKKISYRGVVYTSKPHDHKAPALEVNTVEIIISPKISSLLNDVGLL